jgi:hypothetical protein
MGYFRQRKAMFMRPGWHLASREQPVPQLLRVFGSPTQSGAVPTHFRAVLLEGSAL